MKSGESVGSQPAPCGDFLELASALVDGELMESEALFLQRHLSVCPSCRESLHLTYHVRNWVRAADGWRSAKAPPADFAASLSRRLAGEGRERRVPGAEEDRGWGRFAASLAAAALLVVGGLTWSRIEQGTSEGPLLAQGGAALHEEGSMASYMQQHALGALDATFLEPAEGVELASFELLQGPGR